MVVAERARALEIRSLLEHSDEIEIVGEVADSREAIEKVRELSPNVVHVAMPRLDGMELMSRIHRESPGANIVWTLHFGGGPSPKIWKWESPPREKAPKIEESHSRKPNWLVAIASALLWPILRPMLSKRLSLLRSDSTQ